MIFRCDVELEIGTQCNHFTTDSEANDVGRMPGLVMRRATRDEWIAQVYDYHSGAKAERFIQDDARWPPVAYYDISMD